MKSNSLTLMRRGYFIIAMVLLLALLLSLGGPAFSAEPAYEDTNTPPGNNMEPVLHALNLDPVELRRGGQLRALDRGATIESELQESRRQPATSTWFVETHALPRVGKSLTLTGDGVIEFPSTPSPISHPTRLIQKGTRITGTDDGCEFEGHVQLSGRPVGPLHIIELARNPNNCTSLVELGYGVRDAAGEPQSVDGLGELDNANAVIDSSSNVPTPADDIAPVYQGSLDATTSAPTSYSAHLPHYYAYTRSQVREIAYPLIPPTSEARTETWVYNNNPGVGYGHRTSTNLSGNSGWYRDVVVSDHTTSTAVRTQIKIHAKFLNDIFCGHTRAYHWPTVVEGHRNFLSNHPTNTTWNGDCSGLLRGNRTIDLIRFS